MNVLGFDSSEWQDRPETPAFIDANKAVAAGAKFAICRISYGLEPDRIGTRAFDAFRAAGMPMVAVYQFADYRTYAKHNVAKMVEHLAGRDPDKCAIDLENNEAYWPGNWPADGGRLTYWVNDWLTAYKQTKLKPRPLLYTNPGILKLMRSQPVLLAQIAQEMDLWTTWWTTGEPDAASIAPWTRYTIRQPTPSAVGAQFGMESGNLDLDYYNGSIEEMLAWKTGAQVLTVEERLAIVEQKQKDHGW
jgi:hypothetical protein